jgi:hypothetical protein
MQEVNLIGVLSTGVRLPVIEPKNITVNDTYTAPEGVDGFSPVTVNVQPVIEPKNITVNDTYTAPEGVDGFSPVTVNIPQNCNMYSSNNDQIRLYENVFSGINILVFNGLYINTTFSFNDIDNEIIKNKLINLTVKTYARVFNSSSQTTSYNQIGIDTTAQIFRYYKNNLYAYDAGNVYGSLILVNCDVILNQYPVQNNPNIGG